MVQIKWADPFGNERPKQEVDRDFSSAWRMIVCAQRESSLEPKDERQRSGDEEQIIEVPSQKRAGRAVRCEEKTIHHVGHAGEDAKRIAPVAERARFQSASRTKPVATAIMILKSVIIVPVNCEVCAALSSDGRTFRSPRVAQAE